MRIFLMNLLLAFVWRAVTGVPGLINLMVGFVIGYMLLWWMRPLLIDGSSYFSRLPRAISFAGFFIVELVKSNFRVAWDVITPKAYRQPGFFAVPLDAESDAEITLLANLITLTPGTLSIDVSTDRKVLYVHGMFVEDVENARRQIKDGFERRVLNLLR